MYQKVIAIPNIYTPYRRASKFIKVKSYIDTHTLIVGGNNTTDQ